MRSHFPTRGEPDGVAALESAAVTQAMEWFTCNRAGELSPSQKQAFMEWLRASPLHVNEYLAAARLAQDLPEVAARLQAERPVSIEQIRAEPEMNVIDLETSRAEPAARAASGARFWSGRKFAVAAAVAMAVLGAILTWNFAPPGMIGLPRAIEVAHGEQRTLQLRDGSVAHLNTDTRIKVRYSQGQRLIEFERGQALFQVAHDPARPFRVRAGSAEVVAVGTQFELYRKASGDLTVTVVEGKVDVLQDTLGGDSRMSGRSDHRSDYSSASAIVSSDARPLRLSAGKQIRLGARDAKPRPVPVDLRAAIAWVQREVVFNQQPLSEVAAEFDRYSSIPVVIDDPALRELRVSGIFKAYDIDSFVGFLRQFEGVEVEHGPDVIRVQRRAAR